MRHFLVAAAVAFAGLPAIASDGDLMMVESTHDAVATMDRLEAGVTGAGARVFARVDHAAGAASVDMALAPTQVLIFGNPNVGTQAMLDDPRAGLFLPMRVLVYEDADGKAWLAYQDPAEMFDDLEIDEDAEYITMMTRALDTLTSNAAGH